MLWELPDKRGDFVADVSVGENSLVGFTELSSSSIDVPDPLSPGPSTVCCSGDMVVVVLLNDDNPAELTGSGVTVSEVCSPELSSSVGVRTELESVTDGLSEPDDSSVLSNFDVSSTMMVVFSVLKREETVLAEILSLPGIIDVVAVVSMVMSALGLTVGFSVL